VRRTPHSQRRRYVLSLPVSTLVCGIQSRANLRQDLAIARSFAPMSPDEIRNLTARSAEHATGGRFEPYKTGNYGCDWFHKQRKSA
jgi:hypothetical protein